MTRKSQWRLLAATLTTFVAAILWVSEPYGAAQALAECLRPATTKMMPLPEGCIQTSETPPENLMRIVERQRASYGLTLQRVVVCRTARRLSSSGPDLAEAAFSEETRKRWLPLYVGCCSYQFRRHVAVVVADVSENGSLLVEAALVQSRWLYFRLNWRRNDRSYWY